ncbi:transcriptional regulator [Nocardia yunnanensis]|uniref:Transcriptional regulator n=1 Tax=Nocardia yunnanensis TaxID=2382165 RepID=A0A386ZGS1_9NOCA|nr:transcriptional regulator [Nocardia yunnanensis]
MPARFESLVPVLLTLIEAAGGAAEVPRRLSDLGAWHRLWKAARGEVDSSRVGCLPEATATLIRAFECLLIPELLQTEDYARAVVTLGYWTRSERLRRVELHRRCRDILAPRGGPTVWAVLDEAVLRRPVGGAQVLRAQLEHLVEMSSWPNVVIQVLPFGASGHTPVGTSFTLLRFAGRALPDIVYLHQLNGTAYLNRPAELDLYRRAMDCLATQADSQDRSRARLMAAAAGL